MDPDAPRERELKKGKAGPRDRAEHYFLFDLEMDMRHQLSQMDHQGSQCDHERLLWQLLESLAARRKRIQRANDFGWEAARMFVYRHLDHYIQAAFPDNPEIPLSLDEITLRIRDALVEEGRPGVTLRNRTLANLVEKYEQEHGQQLLVEVARSKPPAYCLLSES